MSLPSVNWLAGMWTLSIRPPCANWTALPVWLRRLPRQSSWCWRARPELSRGIRRWRAGSIGLPTVGGSIAAGSGLSELLILISKTKMKALLIGALAGAGLLSIGLTYVNGV